MKTKANGAGSTRGVFLISAAVLLIGVLGSVRSASAADSAAGDTELAQAMESLSRGTLASAREALAKLDAAIRARPGNPLYAKVRSEIEILFRAEYAVGQSRAGVEAAAKEAEGKLRSMKLSLEPSKLTGRNDPIAAERYQKQAEEIVAKAAAVEDQAIRDFQLALARANLLANDMLADGEESVALGFGGAISAVSSRNLIILTSEEGTAFRPAITAAQMEELALRVKTRHIWVQKGMEMEKEGQKEAALGLYERAGYREGIRRLSGQ